MSDRGCRDDGRRTERTADRRDRTSGDEPNGREGDDDGSEAQVSTEPSAKPESFFPSDLCSGAWEPMDFEPSDAQDDDRGRPQVVRFLLKLMIFFPIGEGSIFRQTPSMEARSQLRLNGWSSPGTWK